MKIREAARVLGVSARTIRYYEEKGLLTPAKEHQSGYRVFTAEDIERLKLIIALRQAGMKTASIAEALASGLQQTQHATDTLRLLLQQHRSETMQLWLSLRQQLETTEGLLQLLELAPAETIPITDMFRQAQDARVISEQRGNWQDHWNYDRLAAEHDQMVLRGEGIYRYYEEALAATVSRLAPVAGESGIDLGTGTGNLAGRLLALGATMSAIDQSPAMLAQAASKYPQLETRLGNMLAIPYIEGKFNFIASSFAFRHLSKDQQILALEEMHRVLRPGGRICLVDLISPPASAVSSDSTADPVGRKVDVPGASSSVQSDTTARENPPASVRAAAVPNGSVICGEQLSPGEADAHQMTRLHTALRPALKWLTHHHYDVELQPLCTNLYLLYAVQSP
ncbi:MerR family transcriptional regulator [Paenibacillus sp. SYP-B4298]|uniref:MerR family transcriptional regulator n=1 Tax=Paenibacillus sp. SYP-B4298 TaxID=2996034 RepID=UPI0022DDCDB8|nr:MerR family transcriptional regulator [Paenibacillus sp. SYP-B4298]